MSRLIILSNRLPVTIKEENGELVTTPSTGGLATGMKSLSGKKEIIWLGWPGAHFSKKNSQRELVRTKLVADGMFPVFIDKTLFQGYYEGFSNETLWPLFHYFQDYTKFVTSQFKMYKQVNELFVEELVKIAKPDDVFWVQDYQLMLTPALIRKAIPKASIGFFLHIPFPSYEIFRTLPSRTEILNGVLGADLIGFHTYDYMRHFLSAVSRILNTGDSFLGKINHGNRVIEVDCFPMGIDYNRFSDAVELPKVQSEIKRYSKAFKNEKIILSIDRLDYTKALPQRLKAFEKFLDCYPQYIGKVTMLIILVPSRSKIEHYKTLKDAIDLAVGRINGKFGRSSWIPIHYYYRAFRFKRLIAYYNISPIAWVTPFRDGMNLVSKEYIATKKDGTGVLILSEMAGAAKELRHAIVVNPNSTADMVQALHDALEMPEEEQIRRMHLMQKSIKRNTVNHWAKLFLTHLEEICKETKLLQEKNFNPQIESIILNDYKKADRCLILLDYDGTLKEFHQDPKKASPDQALFETLQRLIQNPHNDLVLISGRDHETMEEWFGHLPIKIISDHGIWRKLDKKEWVMSVKLNKEWMQDVIEILEVFNLRTPGSLIEEKSYSIAWHYRTVDPGLAEIRKKDLLSKLSKYATEHDLIVLEGNMVIEIKAAEINKGVATTQLLTQNAYDFILTIGDDFTDEDTFAAMPDYAYSIKVGQHETIAQYRIKNVEAVRALLNNIGATT